ncbi:MAG: phosphoribosyl-AMP cyclohydrolase [Acidobacteria bacterium]|nr:MAG: phosphoribosyl-AMP cyclohydrolase [Acidobacteriota bacterium]
MKTVNLSELDFQKGDGLIPVVAQDAATGDVLMVAYANDEAVKRTLETGYAHYWSRSRQELWKKGATSGHLQKVREILVDCDQDTLLYLIDQTGPACHTGERSCFHRRLTG